MSTTVCSDDDYVVVIQSTGTSGSYFFEVKDGQGTTHLKVHDSGEMEIDGLMSYDTGPAVITTSSTTSADICKFTGGSTSGTPLRVNRSDGSTRVGDGEVVLVNSSSSSITGQGDGDLYWYWDGSNWNLRVYVNSGWSDLTAT